MTISTRVTEILDELTEAPQRSNRDTYAALADPFLAGMEKVPPQQNIYATQINSIADEINTTVININNSEASISAVSNYKGLWSTLSGSLDIPASAYHNNTNWQLLEDIADVTAEEPGVSTKWVEIGTYTKPVNSLGVLTGGTDDIDLSIGDTITVTISTAEQTLTFSNSKETGYNDSFVIFITNGGSQVINWPSQTDWVGGEAPSLTAAGLDTLVFTTNDSGTTWYGYVAGLDVK